jgi:hypothetical protein
MIEEKRMEKKTKIIVIAIIFILITIIGFCAYLNYTNITITDGFHNPILCSTSLIDKTLTVVQVEDTYYWEDCEIVSGNATLPSGKVELGDVITNCAGFVRIVHIPTDTLVVAFDFNQTVYITP